MSKRSEKRQAQLRRQRLLELADVTSDIAEIRRLNFEVSRNLSRRCRTGADDAALQSLVDAREKAIQAVDIRHQANGIGSRAALPVDGVLPKFHVPAKSVDLRAGLSSTDAEPNLAVLPSTPTAPQYKHRKPVGEKPSPWTPLTTLIVSGKVRFEPPKPVDKPLTRLKQLAGNYCQAVIKNDYDRLEAFAAELAKPELMALRRVLDDWTRVYRGELRQADQNERGEGGGFVLVATSKPTPHGQRSPLIRRMDGQIARVIRQLEAVTERRPPGYVYHPANGRHELRPPFPLEPSPTSPLEMLRNRIANRAVVRNKVASLEPYERRAGSFLAEFEDHLGLALHRRMDQIKRALSAHHHAGTR